MKGLIAFVVFLIITCSSYGQGDIEISNLKFIGLKTIPFGASLDGARIGGLSGIDYDPASDLYYIISDENKGHFFKAKILLSQHGIDSVVFLSTHSLFLADPGNTSSNASSMDPESIRFNSRSNQIVWSSEGERKIKENSLINPSITIAGTDGRYIGQYTMPANLTMQASDNGPRRNGTLEGLGFADDFHSLYASVEEPLYEDGPPATLTETNSWVRIFQFDVSSGSNVAQYAYKLESVAHPTLLPDAFKVNGISEILPVGLKKLLVMERSFSTGRLSCTVRVFKADLESATDVKDVPSLKEHAPAHPVKKQLLLNMDSLGRYIDNVEGFTFGPNLPNGHRSLIFVSDNNFQSIQKTQFLLFEVIP